MIEYNSSGFIDINRWGYPILCKKKGDTNDSINLIEDIKNFILNHSDIGSYEDKNSILNSLGGEIHSIPNCNVMIWFSRGKKTIEEVQKSLTAILYGGNYSVDVDYEGYSEFTITDYSLNDFTIGGHNLKEIFASKKGKYCNFVLEAYKPVGGLTYSNFYEMNKKIKLPSGKEVELYDLMKIIENLADGESVIIYDKEILDYLYSRKMIQRDCVSYSSVSAVSQKQMEMFYEELEKMIYDI